MSKVFLMSKVLNVTDQDFESEVLKKEGITVVDFYADWCGPCKTLAPILSDLADSKPDIQVRKVNVDDNPESASKYGIRGIPTILFFKDGKIEATKVGSQPLSELLTIIESL
jgi:thioredoxin 1